MDKSSNPNPFEEDNGGDLALDDVSLNMASTDDVTAGANAIYADEDVQRSLQQGDSNISITMNTTPFHEQVPGSKSVSPTDQFQSLEGSPSQALLSGSIDSSSQSKRSSSQGISRSSGGTGSGYLDRCLSFLPCFSVQSYQKYFDVDTVDVADRLKRAVMPWKNDFFETVNAKPDLYGPFWVSSTLILFMAMTSNMSAYLVTEQKAEFKKDITLLTWAMSIVYGFALAMPTVAYFGFQYIAMGSNMRFIELACLYGYSLAPFLVTSLFCMIPVAAVEWVAVVLAFAWSAAFLLRNLSVRIKADGGSMEEIANARTEEGRKTIGIMIVSLLGLHLVFSLLLKFMFFNNAN